MGCKGKFVKPFAETIDKMWKKDTMFSFQPTSFKKGLGDVNEDFKGF